MVLAPRNDQPILDLTGSRPGRSRLGRQREGDEDGSGSECVPRRQEIGPGGGPDDQLRGRDRDHRRRRPRTTELHRSGPAVVQASQPGHVRSAAVPTCVTTGSDGACGSRAGGPPAGAWPGRDGAGRLVGRLGGRAVFSCRRAPRTLRGTVSADPSGIQSVRLASCASAAGAAGRSTARASGSSGTAAAARARSGSATAPSGPTCCRSGSARALHHPRGGDRQAGNDSATGR